MVIRLFLILVALLIVVATGAWLYTRDARYIRWVGQMVRFTLYLLMVLGVLLVLERFGLAAWRVLV